mgnify:FL=1
MATIIYYKLIYIDHLEIYGRLSLLSWCNKNTTVQTCIAFFLWSEVVPTYLMTFIPDFNLKYARVFTLAWYGWVDWQPHTAGESLVTTPYMCSNNR